MKFNKLVKFTILSTMALSLFVGCSQPKEEATTKKSSATIVKDAYGDVEIPNDPSRILAPNAEDSLVALGITPTLQWAIGTDVKDYLQGELKDVPTIEWNVPLEKAIDAQPDFILFSSPAAVPTGQLESFKKIAPIYVFKDEDFLNWRKQLTVMGEIFEMKDKSKKLIEEYEAFSKDAAKEIKTVIKDETVAAIWVVGGQYYVLENNRFAGNVLYSDLGLMQPEMIKKMGSAKDSTWSPVTIEALADLDADHIFLIHTENEAGIDALNNSKIWSSLPATKNNHVYSVNMDDSWTVDGLLASKKVIEDVKNTLLK